MSSKLHTIASYDHEADSISMEVSLVDTATNILHPEIVSSGVVQILYCSQKITEIRFDNYFGNADGTFKFTVAHPSARSGLTFDVGVTTDDGTGFASQGAVTHTTPNEITPQPTTTTPTFPTIVPIRGPLKGIVIATCNDNNISVEVSLLDPISNILHPEEVKSGTVQLLYTNVLLSEISFDRNFGNADGTFKFFITNPGITKGLFVRTNIFTIHPMVGTSSPLFLTGIGPVVPSISSSIPLSANPTPDPNDYRGIERLIEDGSLSILSKPRPVNPDFPTRIISPSSDAVIHIFRKTLKTTLSVTDRIEWVRESAFNESIAISDQTTPSTDYRKLFSDTIYVTDSFYNESNHFSDSELITELLQESVDYVKDFSDTTSTTDLIQTELIYSDAIDVTDVTTRIVDYNKEQTDSLTTTERLFRELDNEYVNTIFIDEELVQREAQWRRSSTDTATVTDSIAVTKTGGRITTDAASVTDSVSRTKFAGRTVTDTATTTDSTARTKAAGRIATDTATVIDTGANVTSIESFYDNDLVIPTGSMGISADFTMDETVVTAETLSKITNQVRTQTDTAIVTESMVRGASYRKTQTDTATVTDSIYVTCYRTKSDTLTITDSMSKAVNYRKTQTDTATTTDSATRTKTTEKTIATDTLAIVDTGANVTSIESFLDIDLVIPDGTIGKILDLTIDETIVTADSVTRSTPYAARTTTDTVDMVDTVTISLRGLHSVTIQIGEAYSTTDSLSKAVNYIKTLTTDALTSTDSITTIKTFSKTINDTLAVTDSHTELKTP